MLLRGDNGAVPEGDGTAWGKGRVADRTLDSLPFDMTKTVQKSGAHLITLLGMSSTLNSLSNQESSKTILENFQDKILVFMMSKFHGNE